MQKKEVYLVGGMTCAACASRIEKRLKKLEGLERCEVSLLQHKLYLERDESKITEEQICKVVEKLGYTLKAPTYAKNLVEKEGQRNSLEPKKDKQEDLNYSEYLRLRRNLYASLIFALPLFYLAMASMMGLPLPEYFSQEVEGFRQLYWQLLLCLPLIYIHRKVFRNGFKALYYRSPNMDSLIALGSGAAFVYGFYILYFVGEALKVQDIQALLQYRHALYFESAGTILTLVCLGKTLEARAKMKTSNALNALLSLAPSTCRVIRNSQEYEIPLEDLKVEDVFLVRSGETLPADGLVIEGYGTVDEAALTGESLPVEKMKDHKVLAGSIQKSGYLYVQATRVGQDSSLAKIIRLVEEAGASKAPIAQLADRISAFFVPLVLFLALLSFIYWYFLVPQGGERDFSMALSFAIAVLVISCPCALGLATPTSIMVAMGRSAKEGVLFKTAETLQTLGEADVIIFDKTGTLTEGKPSIVRSVEVSNKYSALQIAASMEYASEHPLSKAFADAAEKLQISFLTLEDFVQIPGEGLEGHIEGRHYALGNEKMLRRLGVKESWQERRMSDFIHEDFLTIAKKSQAKEDLEGAAEEKLEFEKQSWFSCVERYKSEGKILLFLVRKIEEFNPSRGDKPYEMLAFFVLEDQMKEDASQVIQALKRQGLTQVMLTGDAYKTAQYVQKKLGIDDFKAEVLPEDKEAYVHQWQKEGKKVIMLGDGINDAPALKRADIGIAVGGGTDIAIQASDLVLLQQDLQSLLKALAISRACIRNIKQNLFWALIYNVIGIPLAAGLFFQSFGLRLDPMFAAFAMSFSSLFVVSNALRLKKQKLFHQQS